MAGCMSVAIGSGIGSIKNTVTGKGQSRHSGLLKNDVFLATQLMMLIVEISAAASCVLIGTFTWAMCELSTVKAINEAFVMVNFTG